jgi:hypothetical protein
VRGRRGSAFSYVATVLVAVSLHVGPVSAAELGSIPDFSGLWGRNSVSFEPPPSGPGPIRNMPRKPSDPLGWFGDYTNPILTPGAAAQVKRLGEISLRNEVYPDPANQCRPQPPPYVLWHLQMKILQEQDQITILYMTTDQQVRRVRMNQPHPLNVQPSWYGDSVGRYEGDTLVIDTIGLKVGPLSMVDHFGTPHSEALHLVERYRLIDGRIATEAAERNERGERIPPAAGAPTIAANYSGKGLQVEFTVEDSNVFTMPWSAHVTYRLTADNWDERICAENTGGFATRSMVPQDDTPDF